jgi:hypothetical protein
MMNLIDNNQMPLASIVFSDESTFILRAEVYRQYWGVIVIGLTITLIGCEKIVLSSRKNECMDWDNK